MMSKYKSTVCFLTLLLGISAIANSAESEGTIKAGFRTIDQVGSLSVNQPTYNLFDGATFHVENLFYRLDNGLTFRANGHDLLNNGRNLNLSFGKADSERVR